MAEKPFVTEKFRNVRFTSLKQYLDFLRKQKARFSALALGAPGPVTKVKAKKRNK